MAAAGQRAGHDASVSIAGVQYELDDGDEPAISVQDVATQPADSEVEFERRIYNRAFGWGESPGLNQVSGRYNYGAPAVLHVEDAWFPGAAYTDRSSAVTAPTVGCSFLEFWDGTAANRRLIVVAARHIYEIQPDGTITDNDASALVPATARMTKGIRYKAPTAMSAPKVFIPVQNGGATDYFITRSAENTYIENTGTKRAVALTVAKDLNGDDVVARVKEDGKLNFTTEDTDPDAGASWAADANSYPIGEHSAQVNDLFQQARSILVGRPDGAYKFDNLGNAIPITRGMEQTPDDANFRYFKDFNGAALAPTVQGLVMIDGLDWYVCGPVSSSKSARNLRGREVAVSGQLGEYVYCGVLFGSDTHIFLGTPRIGPGMGQGPFIWHGPVAVITGKSVTDLHGSATVVGKRLWIGCVDEFGSIELNDDWTPKHDQASGYIYLPDGMFNQEGGPGIINDFRVAEFVSPPGTPFAATNAWAIEMETTPGSGTYVAVDGGVVNSGTYAERFWSTETSGRQLRARLAYTGNAGAAELRMVIVRGTQRPETTDEYTVRLKLKDQPRTQAAVRLPRTAKGDWTTLRALVDAGRQAIQIEDASFTGQVKHVSEIQTRPGRDRATERFVTVRIRKVVTS